MKSNIIAVSVLFACIILIAVIPQTKHDLTEEKYKNLKSLYDSAELINKYNKIKMQEMDSSRVVLFHCSEHCNHKFK